MIRVLFPTASAVFVAACAVLLPGAAAADRHVDSLDALRTTLRDARPGDTVIVKTGRYTATAPIVITQAGSSAAPLTIRAETVGSLTLDGVAGFRFEQPAAHVVVSGFVFAHASGQTVIGSGSGHCRIMPCVFECVGAGPYLTVTGDDAEGDRRVPPQAQARQYDLRHRPP